MTHRVHRGEDPVQHAAPDPRAHAGRCEADRLELIERDQPALSRSHHGKPLIEHGWAV
jgi:hypothetical protein